MQRSIKGNGFLILNVCRFTANQAQGKNTLPFGPVVKIILSNFGGEVLLLAPIDIKRHK